jgi:hypothetical protein
MKNHISTSTTFLILPLGLFSQELSITTFVGQFSVLQLFLFIVALIIVSVLIRIITIFPIGPFLKGYRTLGNTDLNLLTDW